MGPKGVCISSGQSVALRRRYTAAMKNRHLWGAILIAALIGGCGQKGPLVLPDAPKHKKVAPSPRAPAATPSASAPDSPAGTPDSPSGAGK